MIADAVVLRIVMNAVAAALARHSVVDDFGNHRLRPVGHEQNLVGQQDGLVNIVRDHEHRLACGGADTQQLILDHAAGQRIQCAEGLVQQQHFWFDGKGARDADALLHAA